MALELNETEYKVTAEGVTVELFAKEFMLLQFLYRNRGLAFSREQLLDKVWPLEYPVERTVDDHIYRLRKKLGKLGGMEIKTVRGFGYSLTVQDTAAYLANPTIQDLELHRAIGELFQKYHQYGQGKSMLTLARQQDVLGYEMAPFYSVWVHFVQGDWEWLLNNHEVPLKERLYVLVLCYMYYGSPKTKVAFCEQVLEKKLLAPDEHTELEILNILDLYALAGESDKALERLQLTHQVIAGPGYESFIPQTAITEMFVHLVAGAQEQELERMAAVIEEEHLRTKPYLREIGSYNVVKGMWSLRSKEWRRAESLLDEGLRVLEMSGFAPMRLGALHRICYYCELFPPKPSLQLKYVRIFEEELEQQGLHRLIQPLEAAMLAVLQAP